MLVQQKVVVMMPGVAQPVPATSSSSWSIRYPPPRPIRTQGVEVVKLAARQQALSEYRNTIDEEEMAPTLRRALDKNLDMLFLRFNGRVRGVILYTVNRRERYVIKLVHVHPQYREQGFALTLIDKLQSRASPNATMTVESPTCESRPSIGLLLSCGFLPNKEIFECDLDDCSRTHLIFFWQKTITLHDQVIQKTVLNQLSSSFKYKFLSRAAGRALDAERLVQL